MQLELIQGPWHTIILADDSDKTALMQFIEKELDVICHHTTNPTLKQLGVQTLTRLHNLEHKLHDIHLPSILHELLFTNPSSPNYGCANIIQYRWDVGLIAQIQTLELQHNKLLQVHGWAHNSNYQFEQENNLKDFMYGKKNMFTGPQAKGHAAGYASTLKKEIDGLFAQRQNREEPQLPQTD